QGKLVDYTKTVMWTEWAEGRDIGDTAVLQDIAAKVGLDAAALVAAADDPAHQQTLDENWKLAETQGVIGVPTFVVGEEIFWGNDRIGFLAEHLDGLGLRRPGKTY